MRAELAVSPGVLYGFLLVLARVGGALIFVPMPGIRSGPEPARVALAAGFTLALFSRWPMVDPSGITVFRLAGWVLAESAIGVAIGVAVSMALEAFSLAAQILGLQAGYAYASTVDPSTDADSGVLLVLAQLGAMMLFFAMGLDRDVLRLFARSFEAVPPGSYAFGRGAADAVVRLGSVMISTAMRLAFPVVALLVLVDVALALAGRVNQQLQLLSLAFPAKMGTALAVLALVVAVYPRILAELMGHAGSAVRRLLGI